MEYDSISFIRVGKGEDTQGDCDSYKTISVVGWATGVTGDRGSETPSVTAPRLHFTCVPSQLGISSHVCNVNNSQKREQRIGCRRIRFRNCIIQNMASIIKQTQPLIDRQNLLQRHTSMKSLNPCRSPEPESQLKRVDNYVYHLRDLIGEGYSSKVYKTKKDNTHDTLAIKVVTLKKQSSSNLEMLQEEINILREISHKNVIKCLDIIVQPQICYIVTEYCEGGDLYSNLKKGILTYDQKNEVIRDVLKGYGHLVTHGIVHRDIKPANVFLKQGVWKLADFGFSKKACNLKARESVNVGTPLYMPPESLLQNNYSVKSDIFALGVMFYELLFGVSPWHSRTEKELINKMTKDPLVVPSASTPEFRQFLEGCLSIDVSKRFTFDEMMCCEFVTSLFNNPESPSHLTLKRSTSTGVSVSPESEKCPSKIKPKTKRNTQILINQINFCRFMFYIYRNKAHLAANNAQKNRLSLILLKHINILINKISVETQANSFKIEDFEAYKLSSEYSKIHKTAEQYRVRYEKELQEFKGGLSTEESVELNRSLNFFTIYENRGVDKTFYSLVNSFIKLHLKEACLQMTPELKKTENESNCGSIEFLRNLFNYSLLLDLMIRNMEDFELFTDNSKIEVNIDYARNKCSFNTFTELKDKIKQLVI